MKLLVGSVILLTGLVPSGAGSQHMRLRQACDSAASAVGHAVADAVTTQVTVIDVQFRVVVPGTVTGRMAFNPSGQAIRVASGKPSPPGFRCGAGAIGASVPMRRGHSEVVSTLRRRFTTAGRYTLTFDLNSAGRRILARLGARQRAYREHHPHGGRPPSIAFGVGFSYVPAG
ncbi:MAG TPA: hypothetical protein VMA77_12200 [Solirubrobacteraceae bacterium]|nr:hypothetical protein [Solirubrobacteraceae bacterium]